MDNLLFAMWSPKKNLRECHGYPACYVTFLLSSLRWNQCPLCRGMTVQFAVESVSSLVWNTQLVATHLTWVA